MAYWFVNMAFTKKTIWRQNTKLMLAYRIPTVLGVLLLYWSALRLPRDLVLIPPTFTLGIFSAGICVLGLLGALWSRWTLSSNWSGDVTFKDEHELVDCGPYRFVRHPIYTSILLMMFGTALSVGRLWSFIALPLLVAGFVIKLKQEEELMLSHFPNEYPNYKTRVKALIPFVL